MGCPRQLRGSLLAPTEAHICTCPQSHLHPPGLRVELVKTSQPLGESPWEAGARLRMTLDSLGSVSEACLLLIPHAQPWPEGTTLPVSQLFPPLLPSLGWSCLP